MDTVALHLGLLPRGVPQARVNAQVEKSTLVPAFCRDLIRVPPSLLVCTRSAWNISVNIPLEIAPVSHYSYAAIESFKHFSGMEVAPP
jgi:hypothetical protein